MKKKPITKQDKIFNFANIMKPNNFYILKQSDDLKWPMVRKIGRRRKNVLIVDLIFRDKHSTNEEGEFAKIYGPVKISENVAIAQIHFFPFYYKANWKVAFIHCFAHILVEKWRSFKTSVKEINNLRKTVDQSNEQINHDSQFRLALEKILEKVYLNLNGRLDKWTIIEIYLEMEIFKLLNPISKTSVNHFFMEKPMRMHPKTKGLGS